MKSCESSKADMSNFYEINQKEKKINQTSVLHYSIDIDID